MSGPSRYAVAVLTALLAIAPVRPHAQDATYRTVIERVRLDALVTEGGRPITGLSAADFELFDNGVRQRPEYVSLDTIPVNVVFALDMSESVSGRTLDALRHGVDAVARGLRTGDQTALVTFNHRVSLGAALSADVSRLTAALSSIAPTGATSLVDALYASLWIAEPDPGRAVVIVFSDGVDTASWLTADRVVDAARQADAVVYAVTTRGGRRDPFLAELTETTGGRTFDVSSSDRLTDAFESILAEFRQRYVIAYSPTGVKAAGWHTLDLRVRGRRASVKTRQGYLAGPN